MPKFVMKVDKDRDFYIEWSTVVDNWTFVGDRAEMLEYLEMAEPRGYTADPGHRPEDRLQRADENGTSALFPSRPPFEGAWDDRVLMVEQRGLLAREDLARYLDAWDADGEAAAYVLLRPFDDDEPVAAPTPTETED
jgi:hypothetical protein